MPSLVLEAEPPEVLPHDLQRLLDGRVGGVPQSDLLGLALAAR